MRVLFDVTTLMSKHLSDEGKYTSFLFRALKGLGVEIEPVYKKVRGGSHKYIDQHIGTSSKKYFGLFAPKDSILHGPAVDLLSESPKHKRVISVNDMSMFRDGFMSPRVATQLQNHMREQFQKNPLAVIVPSDEVHNEVLIRFPKFVGKVHVVSPGCDHIIDSSGGGVNRISKKPYFLFSGSIDKRSNLSGVIRAFEGFCEMQPEVNLVIIGAEGYGSESAHKMVLDSSHRDRMILFGRASVFQLKHAYAGAICTLTPSLYEGFPYSMVEAMKLSCPVISSGRGAMEELGRDAALLVNPTDPEQILAAMVRIYRETSLKDKLVEAGREVTEKMTWLQSAKSVYEIYKQIH